VTVDANEEAKHLRELVLKARQALEAAGFEGVTLQEQVHAAVDAARDGEQCRQELVKLRDRLDALADLG
jgi:Xaa-Pro aminopeptidase